MTCSYCALLRICVSLDQWIPSIFCVRLAAIVVDFDCGCELLHIDTRKKKKKKKKKKKRSFFFSYWPSSIGHQRVFVWHLLTVIKRAAATERKEERPTIVLGLVWSDSGSQIGSSALTSSDYRQCLACQSFSSSTVCVFVCVPPVCVSLCILCVVLNREEEEEEGDNPIVDDNHTERETTPSFFISLGQRTRVNLHCVAFSPVVVVVVVLLLQKET